VNDGHEVFGELSRAICCSHVLVIPSIAIDDQFNTTGVEKKFEKLDPESSESVAVGDNNFLDHSLDTRLDQGLLTMKMLVLRI